MNIVIVGQGAIGLLWYHHLAKDTANRISLLCSARTKHVPTHYRFTDISNQSDEYALKLADANAIAEANLIIFCVKSYQVNSAIECLKNKLPTTAAIVFCHNGMGTLDNLTTLVQPTLVLLTTHGCKIAKPFQAIHTGLGHSDLGLLSGLLTTATKKAITDTLQQALPTLLFVENIKEKQWLKLAINCVINPLTSIYNIDNGLLLDSKFDLIVTELINEIVTVASAEGVKFELNDLKQAVMLVAKNTANNCSSMRSDVQQKRKTEIDYINGHIVKIAKEHKISAPQNLQLLLKVKALESAH